MATFDSIKKKKFLFTLLLLVPVFLSIFISTLDRDTTTTDSAATDDFINFSLFLDSPLPPRSYSDEAVVEQDEAVVDFDHGLEYDYYRQACPRMESIVRSVMARIYAQEKDISPGLLRLLFHDCFIKGCDASVLLDDGNGSKNDSAERQAPPNRSLKGFRQIEKIKQELEKTCPGVVSCADILAVATREAILLIGGPFYPVFTGRKDSTRSYFSEAEADIPNPGDTIDATLHNFASRGFDDRETVSLLGAHNIGTVNCKFIQGRLFNFSGIGKPDPSIAPDFLDDLRLSCQDGSKTFHNGTLHPMLTVSLSSGTHLDSHYYQNLLKGRGLLFSDQELMADRKTAAVVRVYASDDGTTFRRDFARVMVKLSNLDVLTGNQGEVRTKCFSTGKRF